MKRYGAVAGKAAVGAPAHAGAPARAGGTPPARAPGPAATTLLLVVAACCGVAWFGLHGAPASLGHHPQKATAARPLPPPAPVGHQLEKLQDRISAAVATGNSALAASLQHGLDRLTALGANSQVRTAAAPDGGVTALGGGAKAAAAGRTAVCLVGELRAGIIDQVAARMRQNVIDPVRQNKLPNA